MFCLKCDFRWPCITSGLSRSEFIDEAQMVTKRTMSSWLTRGCWEALALKQFQEALPCSAFSRPCWMSNLPFSLGYYFNLFLCFCWGNSGVWVETWSQIIEIKSDLFYVGFTFFFLHVGGTEKRGQSASDVTNNTVCVCVQTCTHTLPLIYTHTHTHLVWQSEVAFSRAFSLITAL